MHFTMQDIDRLSRHVPNICKVAPSSATVHVEDVHRAGGVFAILGELDRAGLLHRDVYTVHSPTLGDGIDRWDITRTQDPAVHNFYRAAPGGIRTTEPSARARVIPRSISIARRARSATSSMPSVRDGGLAVLYGNIAEDGCIVKTAGVDDAPDVFRTAHVFESQDDAVEGILADQVKAGEVVVIRYEGPKGGPGMQEMLYPTSYLNPRDWARLRANYRRTLLRRHLGLSIGHVSPESAEGGRSRWWRMAIPSRSTCRAAASYSW